MDSIAIDERRIEGLILQKAHQLLLDRLLLIEHNNQQPSNFIEEGSYFTNAEVASNLKH